MHYAWLNWSLLLLVVWLAVFLLLGDRKRRREMLMVSLWTSLLGLTEPLFVPAYWNPPSLFNLAQTTGFDIESLLFAFGVGGGAFALYNLLFRAKDASVHAAERHGPRHRFHFWAIASAPIVFGILVFATNLNPIYDAIIAMFAGGITALYCRPDLARKMLASAAIFLAFYFLCFLTLIIAYPGYVAAVWNLKALSGILIFGIPLEELLFAASFGFLWSGVYEHFTWKRVAYIKSGGIGTTPLDSHTPWGYHKRI